MSKNVKNKIKASYFISFKLLKVYVPYHFLSEVKDLVKIEG